MEEQQPKRASGIAFSAGLCACIVHGELGGLILKAAAVSAKEMLTSKCYLMEIFFHLISREV
jgi:hypothetical protein